MTIRTVLVVAAATAWLSAAPQHVALRIMSRTPVTGTEEARSLMFDRYGLLWVGTDQGVSAYDGYRFRTYRSGAYSPGILPNNHVHAMTEDRDGDGLWIGTHDGLAHYDRRRGRFKTYRLRSEQARTVNALFTAGDGTVWAATDAGVARYDDQRDEFVEINMAAGARAFAEDRRGNLYIGTWEGGLVRLDRQSGRMVTYRRMNVRNTVASMLVDSSDRLWIGTWEHGIIRLDNPQNENDPGMHRVNDGRKDFRTFHRLVEDEASHSVWGCCIEGLTRVDRDDLAQVENYPIVSFCYDMQTDGRGSLWVITRNDGIVRLSTLPATFRFYDLDPKGLVLPVNRIQTVFSTDGRHFWLGLQPYGLARYDRMTNRVDYNNHINGFGRMTGTGGIAFQTVAAMTQTDDGETWMGGSHGIVGWREGEEARLMPHYGAPFLGTGGVKAFLRLHDGALLVGQGDGVGLCLPDRKGRMLTMGEQGRDFSSCDVNAMMEDRGHRVWIATENAGIIRISGDVGLAPTAIACHQYAAAHGNYPLDEATACYESGDGRLWAISGSGGLFLYNAGEDRFEPMNHRFHLGVGSIFAIQGDAEGRLWLSTDKGLVRLKIDHDKYVCTYLGEEEGLEAVHFATNGSFRWENELFFGCSKGFFAFEPCRIDRWQRQPAAALVVSGLRVDDRPYEWLDSAKRRALTDTYPFFTRRIAIPAGVEKFSVEFALLTYLNQQQCKYAYRLEGYDRDWHHTDAAERQATYQNLPVGTYQLRLRGTDSYGRQTEMPYAIEIIVMPPWYQTWWARLIYFCLAVAAVTALLGWYKARLQRRARLQQRVSELLHYREMMVMKQFFDKQTGEAEREDARKVFEAEEQQHSSPDELFIQKAIDCVKQHLDDADYDREQFALDMCVSASTLYNKLRALTGQTVTGFVNAIRLKEACRILRERPDIKMTELSMKVGFNTPKYFTKLFKKEFGMLPSDYVGNL